MAAPTYITYATKEDRRTTALPGKNIVVAADMNEIKAKFNDLLTALGDVRIRIPLTLTSASFDGNDYQNPNMVNLTSAHFDLFSNDGAGVKLKEGEPATGGAFTFNTATGTITTTPGNYQLIIFKPFITL